VTDAAPAIVLDAVTVTLGGRRIWAEASFGIEPGEVVAVIGANGSGKSTLLRLILGQIAPSAGRIAVLGSPPRRGNRSIGLVPQRRDLAAGVALRGRDLVALGTNGHRWGFGKLKPDEAERVERALEAVGATEFADEPVERLSGGQQQRLFIAQTLCEGVAILLLDEPLASLDLRSQGEVVGVVADINRKRKVTTLVVTHDLNPFLPILHRVVYILDGRLRCGAVEAVVTPGTLSAMYGTAVQVLQAAGGDRFVRVA
jgi:zinc/manganese transport system ATP-binding protein